MKITLALSILLLGVKFVKIKLIFSFKCLKIFYYIDTDEIPGFLLSLKSHRYYLSLSHIFQDIGVAMVTNMISQLQESFLLNARGWFF